MLQNSERALISFNVTDIDSDYADLTVEIVTTPHPHGSLQTVDGLPIYVGHSIPHPWQIYFVQSVGQEVDTDSTFDYRAFDGRNYSEIATQTIRVAYLNIPPVALAPPHITAR